MPSHVDIAIIGGGYSGAMVAASLNESPRSIALIDNSGQVPRGAAYSTPYGEHLLNVPAVRMGAKADDIEGFYRYAAQRIKAEPSSFLPRALYGDYLSLLAARVAPPIKQRVVALIRQKDHYVLRFADDSVLTASCLVLATGNQLSRGEVAHAQCYTEPWECDFDALTELKEPIVIIGSGLTAVDTLVSLRKRRVSAPITVISRHGRFPAVHADNPLAPCPDFLPASLAGLSLSLQMREVRRFIVASAAAGHSWQAAIDALRPHTIALWCALDDRAKSRFFRHVFTHWNRARHRMAPSLYPFIEEGYFTHKSGRVASVTAHGVVLTTGEALPAAYVFDCRGIGYKLSGHPLYASLLGDGTLRPHATGMGLATTGDAGRVSAEGTPPIYALGALLMGERLESTAVPDLRQQVADVAGLLSA